MRRYSAALKIYPSSLEQESQFYFGQNLARHKKFRSKILSSLVFFFIRYSFNQTWIALHGLSIEVVIFKKNPNESERLFVHF